MLTSHLRKLRQKIDLFSIIFLPLESLIGMIVGQQKRRSATQEALGTESQESMKRRTKAELMAWIEQHQPVTRGKLLDAFEDMDYEQLQRWLSELQLKRKLFEINPETYYTTIEPPEYGR